MKAPSDGAINGQAFIEEMLAQLRERDAIIAALQVKVSALETVVKLIRDYSHTILEALHDYRAFAHMGNVGIGTIKAIEGAARVIRSIQENRL